MTPSELFRAGQLSAAVQATTQQVKSSPTDMAARTLLFELLCFAGELDRAQRQLDVLGQQNEESAWPVQVYQNILTAERLRRKLFTDGLPPEFLTEPPAHVRQHLAAIQHLRQGRSREAGECLAAAADDTPELRGTLNGQEFVEFRDCDDLIAPVLELILQRDYVWMPFSELRELEISRPERPRDLIWAPVRLVTREGKQLRGYVPVLYWSSFQDADEQVRLGRQTDWSEPADGLISGRGARMLLAGEEGVGALECQEVTFAD